MFVLVLAGCVETPPNTTPSTLPSADGAALVPGGVVACEGGDGPRLVRTEIGADWAAPALADPRAGEQGFVVADLDQDGWFDLVMPRSEEDLRVLFGAADGSFAQRPTHDDPILDTTGGSAADADGDGDVDVLLFGYDAPLRLLVNDGAGHFDPVEIDPDPSRAGCGGAAAWGDMDLDGDLDLFFGRRIRRDLDEDGNIVGVRCESVLLENEGGLVFADRSEQLSNDVQLDQVMAAGWHDLDDDPYPELYVVSDLPTETPGNRLLDNVDGALVEVAQSSLHFNLAGMGLGVGDFNDDEVLDLVIPGIMEIRLMTSSSPGVWVDAARSMDLYPQDPDQDTAWSTDVADLDNDGDLDIVTAYGPREGEAYGSPPVQPSELYLREGDRFVGAAAAWGWQDPGSYRGALAVDLDHDGSLDLIKRAYGGGATVDHARCDGAAWLEVRLHDATANRSAVGARVVVTAGDQRFVRTVVAGSTSYYSGGPPEAHFGLGDLDSVDAIEVVWPEGATSSFPGVDSRQVVDVYRSGLQASR